MKYVSKIVIFMIAVIELDAVTEVTDASGNLKPDKVSRGTENNFS